MNKGILTMLVIIFVSIPVVYSQGTARMGYGRGPGGWGMGCSYCQDFDPKNTATVSGTVEKTQSLVPERGMTQGVHILLKTGNETISVHLGPQWYIENQDITIKAGDKIKVKGVRTEWSGEPAVIAYEIEKDDNVLTLRDADGYPVWAGWHGRGMRRGM